MSHVEQRGRGILSWYVVYPGGEGEGMDLERGPYFTRWGARLSRLVWGD